MQNNKLSFPFFSRNVQVLDPIFRNNEQVQTIPKTKVISNGSKHMTTLLKLFVKLEYFIKQMYS